MALYGYNNSNNNPNNNTNHHADPNNNNHMNPNNNNPNNNPIFLCVRISALCLVWRRSVRRSLCSPPLRRSRAFLAREAWTGRQEVYTCV